MSGKIHILETGSFSADKFKCHFKAKICHEHESNVHFFEGNRSSFILSWKTKQESTFEYMQ